MWHVKACEKTEEEIIYEKQVSFRKLIFEKYYLHFRLTSFMIIISTLIPVSYAYPSTTYISD